MRRPRETGEEQSERNGTQPRVGDRDIQGRSQFSRQCTRQPARRVYALCGVFCELHRSAGTRDNEKCTRHDILLARPSYNCSRLGVSPSLPPPSCRSTLLPSLSLPFLFFLPFSLSRASHLRVLLRLARPVGNSGLLNNSLCGLAEMRARVLTRGYFAKLPARCHPPRVTAAETSLFRCNAAASSTFRFLLVGRSNPSGPDDREAPHRKEIYGIIAAVSRW